MLTKEFTKEDPNGTSFEEALEKAGNGPYNILLAITCAIILLAIGVDMFGFSLVVTAACDLDLTVPEKGILTSMPFIGIFLVSYFWGYISDTRGRKFTLVLSLQASFLIAALSSLSPHWLVLAAMKFLSTCFSCAANSATYTLVGESCSPRVRNKYMLLMTCLLLLSPAGAAALAYPTLKTSVATEIAFLGIIFKPWRLLIVVLSLPLGVGAFFIHFFHESPKFLANQGRQDEALRVLKSIHAMNHRCNKEDYKVTMLLLESTQVKKPQSVFRMMYEQSAPLFRKPFLFKTLQLFYITAVVYITNNSFLIWLPDILNLVRVALTTGDVEPGNICSLISTKRQLSSNRSIEENVFNGTEVTGNITDLVKATITPKICLGYIEDNVIFTLIISQCIFSFLNFVISYLPNRRKTVLISVLCLSSISGTCLNLTPEPISSVLFFVIFTGTCVGMGILASFFVDLYPTSYRGMVACLSLMVGRTSTFLGVNLVGNVIFDYCQITFYMWSLLVLSSVVAAWFLPPDKPAKAKEITAL